MNFIIQSHFLKNNSRIRGEFYFRKSFDGVIVRIIRRFNLFWIPPDKGYKLGPPGGLADPIRNVRNVKKTPGWVILEETAVLMGLLLG